MFLGVLCSGLAYVFWYDALRVLPTAKVGSLLYLEPLVTMGVAAALLGEPVRFSSIAGGARHPARHPHRGHALTG